MKTTSSTSALPPWLRNNPDRWNADTLDRDELKLSAYAIRQHPRFHEAKRRFAENMVAAYDNNSPVNRLIRVEADLQFVAFILSLHHTREDRNPESGATYTRLIEMFKIVNCGSPTLIKAMLSLCRIRGFITVKSVRKSRSKILVPTEKLLEALQIWLKAHLSAVELITPLPLPPTTLAAKPEIINLIFTYGVNAYLHNKFYLWEDFPEIQSFMFRSHGYAVLMSLIASSYQNAAGSIFASVPSVELAKRLSISRGTIRNILNEAQEYGWITIISRGSHQIQISHDFAEICNDWISMELTWMGGMTKSAWKTLAPNWI
jgi:hypothetical protein